MANSKLSQLIEFDIPLEVDAYERAPLWIINPRSYFSDRAVPQIEISAVPARKMEAAKGLISGKRALRETDSYLTRMERLTNRAKTGASQDTAPGHYHFDLRHFGLGNWSHCLNQALPMAIFVRDYLLDRDQPPPIFILDGGTGENIRRIFAALGLRAVYTNHAIKAPLITMTSTSGHLVHQNARNFVTSVKSDIDKFVGDQRGPAEKVFLNRRSSRSLVNNADIVALLSGHGYREIHMEDHSIEEQFAILLQAKDIIAIHGAALAPLLFRDAHHGPFNLIEINTPGHIVPFYRDMVASLPAQYRLVRGHVNQKMALAAYEGVDTPSMDYTRAHSLTPFAVDPFSVEVAIESLQSGDFPANVIHRTQS